MAGHWALHGFGMFVLEEKASGRFAGRAGPFYPPVWPGFEVGWGLAAEFRGKGYAVEAARASIDWAFATLSSTRSCTASIRRMSPRKPLRGGSGLSMKARRCCSVTPSISG